MRRTQEHLAFMKVDVEGCQAIGKATGRVITGASSGMGVPTLTAGRIAQAILSVVDYRIPEVMVPRRLAAAVRLGSAFPGLVDRLYARLNSSRTAKTGD